MLRSLFVLLILSLTTPVIAQVPAEVEEAFGNTTSVERDSWAYTRTEINNSTTNIERFDPAAEPRWTLISVNGQLPNSKQQTQAQERFKRREESEEFFGKNDFTDLAREGSWKLIDEIADSATYQFAPAADDETATFVDALQGELTIDRTHKIVKSFRIYNTRSFKPAAVAKMKKMDTRFSFQQIKPGVVLPDRIEITALGKVFGLKKINISQKVEYSELSPVSNSMNSPAVVAVPVE